MTGVMLALFLAAAPLKAGEAVSGLSVSAGGQVQAGSQLAFISAGEPLSGAGRGALSGAGFVFAQAIQVVQLPPDDSAVVSVAFNPRVLNLKSRGLLVNVIIEPSGSRKAGEIAPETLKITKVNGALLAEAIGIDLEIAGKGANYKHVHIGDANGNGVEDLEVKFDRDALIKAVGAGAQAELTLEGRFTDGSRLSGADLIIVIAPGLSLAGESGIVAHPQKAKVAIPKNALTVDTDISITRLGAEAVADLADRNAAASRGGVLRHGKPYEFGPEGLKFKEPVSISLPYDAGLSDNERSGLRLAYWNSSAKRWELLDSSVDEKEGVVTGKTTHFSVYQVVLLNVLAPADGALAGTDVVMPGPDQAFRLGEVYVFPNPAKNGKVPAFHVEVGLADSVKIRVFNVSGRLAHERTVTGAPRLIGVSYAYEYSWEGYIPSGVYYYTVEAEREGKKLRARGKFAVVR